MTVSHPRASQGVRCDDCVTPAGLGWRQRGGQRGYIRKRDIGRLWGLFNWGGPLPKGCLLDKLATMGKPRGMLLLAESSCNTSNSTPRAGF
eukprot:353820-Pyramimonas_sp.AAC.1